jgi:hypothetical protein
MKRNEGARDRRMMKEQSNEIGWAMMWWGDVGGKK